MLLVPLLLLSVLYFVNSTLKEQFINDARSKAGLTASTLSQINPFTNRDKIASQMDEIILSANIVYAEIAMPNGKKITSVLEMPLYEVMFIEDLGFGQHHDDIYYIALPVQFKGIDAVAALRIGFDELLIAEQLSKITRILCAILAIYIALNLTLVFFLGKRTTKPLKTLLLATRRIRHGHVDTHLDIESPVTDIRELTVGLDLMRQELVSQASALKHQATHDALTDLPNRVLLEDRMQQMVLANSRKHTPFCLLLMDLDRFKEVNDTLGHQTGDEVLRQAAQRLSNTIRKGDTVARIGGDEFAVLLHGADTLNADRVAESLILEMKRAFVVEGQLLHIGASLGISHFPDQCDNAEELMRLADIAMYEAKKSVLHYKTYNTSHDEQSLERLTLSNGLREAINTGQITLHYQPKIDLQTGEFKAVEALARWQHPEQGLLMPDKFITLTENNGLIIELTNSLLELAINDASKWYQSGQAIEVSVNLSPKNLLDDTLPDRIADLLEAACLPSEYLSLEITENAIIQEPEIAGNILLTLKEMGVRSIIDDFGTGYSSLVYLRHLPVDEIKIDKSFVLGMMHNDDDQQIVKATIRMAHDMGLTVTAEGIENAVISDQLKKLNCDKGQGYYYSKALTVEKLDEWRVQFLCSQFRKVG